MAKNYVNEGNNVTLPAPTGGVVSGVPAKVGALMVIPLDTVEAGKPFTGKTNGVWRLPATTGLTVGAHVKWDSTAGKLVADTVTTADDFGKLVTAEAGGYADVMLLN